MRRDSVIPFVFVFFTVLLTNVPARAQTTAVGPYLATPAWDQKLSCETLATCPRFIVLSNWNSEAVLDRETGLVWARSPYPDLSTWLGAVDICRQQHTGGRYGWRLPGLMELQSLGVSTVESGFSAPVLPPGHPFDFGDGVDSFWTTTSRPGAPTFAQGVSFGAGIFNDPKTDPDEHRAWCVRGGHAADAQ